MNRKIPKIYPITDTQISGLSHLAQAKSLIAGGTRIVQLREKNAAPRDWFDDALSVAELCREKNVLLIVNDRVDIALAIGADGVHLGQLDLPPTAARKLLGETAIIGFSTHTVEQVRTAIKFPINYVAFGPVFPTSTKFDPDAVVGLEMLKQVRELAGDIPLVAIGGISRDNAKSVLASGADSVAVIGALLSDPTQIESRFREFSDRIDK